MEHISALRSLITIMTAQNSKQTANERNSLLSTHWVMHVTSLAAQIHNHKRDINGRAMITNT